LDKDSLQEVHNDSSSEEESLNSSNENYKPAFKEGDDTISIVCGNSVNSDEINYKKCF
jgi:hypothetical protein